MKTTLLNLLIAVLAALITIFLVRLLFAARVHGQQYGSPAAPASIRAVVRLPSHGLSGTVIYTGESTLILTAAHGFDGRKRHKPITLDAPASRTSACNTARPRLVRIDPFADLALIGMSAGPLPWVSQIARQDARPSERVWSVGYDQMRGRYTVVPTICDGRFWHRELGRITRVDDPPRPGRSGGALFNSRGELVGTVIGFDWRGGIYTNHATIVKFLRGR